MSLLSVSLRSQMQANHSRFLRELGDFMAIPSVSAQPNHAAEMQRCADWLAQQLRRIGRERVQVLSTRHHSLVYAEWRGAAGRPTVLIYGHYDMQPADPLGAWHTPPFQPSVRNGNLYGRCASDDKGQLFCHVKAAVISDTQFLAPGRSAITDGLRGGLGLELHYGVLGRSG